MPSNCSQCRRTLRNDEPSVRIRSLPWCAACVRAAASRAGVRPDRRRARAALLIGAAILAASVAVIVWLALQVRGSTSRLVQAFDQPLPDPLEDAPPPDGLQAVVGDAAPADAPATGGEIKAIQAP
ncbi:MAG TPA: hypothetical protein VFF65_10730 [Phycisphaerales bacterium]|nr:hypothetical protein [Phycisphaerales bacterium]